MKYMLKGNHYMMICNLIEQNDVNVNLFASVKNNYKILIKPSLN